MPWNQCKPAASARKAHDVSNRRERALEWRVRGACLTLVGAMAEVPNGTVINCALLLLGAVATRRVWRHGLFSAELFAPAASLVGGAAALHGAAYAVSLGIPAWAMLALMSVGTLASAGHPFQYLEPFAEGIDEAIETLAIAIVGQSATAASVGLAASGVSLGVLGVGISAALSACFQAHRAIRETAGLATSIVAVCAGLALATPAMLLPAELSHRRMDVVISIAAAQAAASLAYARAP